MKYPETAETKKFKRSRPTIGSDGPAVAASRKRLNKLRGAAASPTDEAWEAWERARFAKQGTAAILAVVFLIFIVFGLLASLHGCDSPGV